MYRILLISVAVAAILIGLLIGILNSELVELDIYWRQLTWPLGLIVILTFVSGLLLGCGLVYFIALLPTRMRLRRLQKQTKKTAMEPVETND